MRGWLHYWSFVVSIAAGVVLVAVAGARVGAGAALATAVYSITILGLFGVSAAVLVALLFTWSLAQWNLLGWHF